jgi:hypothetical protein
MTAGIASSPGTIGIGLRCLFTSLPLSSQSSRRRVGRGPPVPSARSEPDTSTIDIRLQTKRDGTLNHSTTLILGPTLAIPLGAATLMLAPPVKLRSIARLVT